MACQHREATTAALRRLLREPALVRRLSEDDPSPLLAELGLAGVPAWAITGQPAVVRQHDESGVAGLCVAAMSTGWPAAVWERLDQPALGGISPRVPAGGPHLPEVRYRGETLRAAKLISEGEQRSVPVRETLNRIRPLLPRAGITRLADITGLDRVGIPVTMAIRPNGRTLSNHAGKGASLEAAMVSAAMEALEIHHAEEWSPDTVRCSFAQIQQCGATPERRDLPLAYSAPFPEHWPYLWTWGWDLLGQEEVALPVSMLHMGNRDSRIFDLCAFQITSNGLASGNNLIEAIHSGLLEVIERDATTCHKERWLKRRVPPPVLDTAAIDLPAARELLDRLSAADVDTVVFDCSVDTQTPVYMADVIDRTRQVVGTFRGYGAHLDPEIALIRALTEAVQARTVSIAGSRDDLYRHRDVHRGSDREHERIRSLKSGAAPPAAPPVPSEATSTIEQDVLLLMERLRGAGLDRVIVVEMSAPEAAVSVVKVVVPGLEGYRMQSYEPQHRAKAFSAQGSPPGLAVRLRHGPNQ